MTYLFSAVKIGVFAASLLIISPLALISRIERLLTKRDFFYGPFVQILALIPGFPGIYLRGAFYFAVLEHCSWKVHVGFGSLLVNWPSRLADHVTIGAYCVLGHVDIRSGVRIASRVSIPSGKRQHLNLYLEGVDEPHFDTVTIGEDCWLGEGAIVMADVGRQSIVSAGAVVVDNVPPFSIVGGNPAKIIGQVDKGVSKQEKAIV